MKRDRRLTRAASAAGLVILLGLGGDIAFGSQDARVVEWRVEGLEESARILVDRWGVPHVYAEGFDDLFFVQGFNAARDRLWQLDLWLRRGEGRLAEVLGEEFVEDDRAARLLLYRGDMYTEWLAYASDTKRIVTAFVNGINAFITLTRQQPELLPPEFDALDYEPLEWRPESVVSIRSHGLLRNLRGEVRRALHIKEHGFAGLDLLERFEPEHQLEVPEGLDLSLFPFDVLRTYNRGTNSGGLSVATFERLANGADGATDDQAQTRGAQVPRWRERWLERGQLGSNNWAIAPRRTATGRPLLADDPHRALAVPSLRYIVHLSGGGLDVIGAGEPALPGVSIGHNGQIAFGLTIFGIDQEDLYVYETHLDNPGLYLYRGHWEPIRTVWESIGVRDSEAVRVDLEFTRHGPVLHRDSATGRIYALRAAWLEAGMAPYLGSIEYMRARNWDQFLAAMNRWGAPSENQVYADVSGNIGWKPGGRTPNRPNWDGLLPVPGDGRYEWAGYRDMDELPMEANPARGWVATANQFNLPLDFERPTGYEWSVPYRYQRIAEVLEATPKMSVADSVALQADVLSIPARRVLAILEQSRPRAAGERAERVEAALELIEGWDARLEKQSGAAALFEIWWRRHLRPAVVAHQVADPEIAKRLGGGDAELILRRLESGEIPGDELRELLAGSLATAVEDARSVLGSDHRAWRYGDLHQAELLHPLVELAPAQLAEKLRIEPMPRGGSGETVGNTSYSVADFRQVAGASFRMVVDVGNWDRSVAMSSPGQSGDPRSPHYQDLFGPWARDESFPLLYSRKAIEKETVLRIELSPAPAASTPQEPTRRAGHQP